MIQTFVQLVAQLVVELVDQLVAQGTGKRVAAFVSAMGSGGTLAAADQLKARFPSCRAVGVEPMQCPTLYNVGYGAHGIEGIGDKHVTWIHNVRNTDLLICVDDQECIEGLQLLQEGRACASALISPNTSDLPVLGAASSSSGAAILGPGSTGRRRAQSGPGLR